MDMGRLNQAIDAFRDKLGAGLIACDVWGPDGLWIAGYNSQPRAVALFADVTARFRQALSEACLPQLGRYYVLELANNRAVCVMIYRDHQWGCLVDLRKVVMGKLIQLALPKALDGLRSAVEEN